MSPDHRTSLELRGRQSRTEGVWRISLGEYHPGMPSPIYACNLGNCGFQKYGSRECGSRSSALTLVPVWLPATLSLRWIATVVDNESTRWLRLRLRLFLFWFLRCLCHCRQVPFSTTEWRNGMQRRSRSRDHQTPVADVQCSTLGMRAYTGRGPPSRAEASLYT